MAGNRRHVLVIEDDPDTAEQVAGCLSRSGYTVDLASDGDEGLARGRSARYAVMTVDRLLPRIDGIEVIRRLRADGIVTPTLIVSALGEVDDRVRGLRAGDLELDLLTRTASRKGRVIELLPKEFQLLAYLVRHAGEVVPRAMLLQHVWDLHFDPMTNVIDVYVGRLRRKVDGGGAYPLLHTVRGVGFCLRAPD